MLEQIPVPALNTCAKMLREGDDRAKTLLLQALLDINQSKPMRVNMKEPVELEPMKKMDTIRRFSNKELRLTKESMGALPKSSEYCDRSGKSRTVTYPGSLEWHTTLSIMKTYVIVSSTTSSRCC